ncbi:DUF2846 domain-containing protein [Aliikangiella maris]|uniref:DUF2846 domain-containing protein n=2 Tax=Aliikangiella maris TaxID=3162458 RepID=A0ABV2BYQ8_9GAMM
MKFFLALNVIIVIVGCATPASGSYYSRLTSVSPDKAFVYMYRQNRFFQCGTYPNVLIDGVEKFSLRNSGYNFVELTPGEHVIGLEPGLSWTLALSDLKIKVEPEKSYYLKFSFVD